MLLFHTYKHTQRLANQRGTDVDIVISVQPNTTTTTTASQQTHETPDGTGQESRQFLVFGGCSCKL